MKADRKDLKKRIRSFLKRRVLPASISVIVPVYNGEKTLDKCLDSLIGQSQRRIRIICVNDGSTDSSEEILEEYKKKNRRIQVISQKNTGRSGARNVGLEAVKTKYVMFCDSDDYYEKNMCENILDVVEKNRADLGVCGIKVIYKAHTDMKKSDDEYYRLHFNGLKQIDDEVIEKTDASVCNKIFLTSIIRRNEITFPNGLNNEDYYFCNAYMSVAMTAFFLDQKLYCYVRHEGSIMSDNFKGEKRSIDHLLVAQKLFDYYKKNGFLDEHKDLFWRQWIASFWASYRYSEKKYYPVVKREANKFLDKYYEKYQPEDEELKGWKKDIDKTLNKIEGE